MAAPILPPPISETLSEAQRLLDQLHAHLRSIQERITASYRRLDESEKILAAFGAPAERLTQARPRNSEREGAGEALCVLNTVAQQ